MRAAGWCEADPISFRSGLRDAASVLFAQPYVSAPMSTHFLGDRPQDLGFEQIVGGSPRRRHHVRFWRAASAPGEPALWIGAATYDEFGFGISRYTGEVMHHIAPRIDAEREKLFADLARAGRIACAERLAGYRPAGSGVNGGGDVLPDRRRADARPAEELGEVVETGGAFHAPDAFGSGPRSYEPCAK